MASDTALPIRVILASSSPRRRDLLSTLGISFEIIKPDVEERWRPGESPDAYAQRNARAKADFVKEQVDLAETGSTVTIAADTIVVLDDQILEKPRDHDHARTMLEQLSGRRHRVVSGVSMHWQRPGHPPAGHTFAVSTMVTFKPLTDVEIKNYIQTGEPLDKAGAYAAQGIGSYMVKRIEGSYTNVVGLPVAEVTEALKNEFGIDFWNLVDDF